MMRRKIYIILSAEIEHYEHLLSHLDATIPGEQAQIGLIQSKLNYLLEIIRAGNKPTLRLIDGDKK